MKFDDNGRRVGAERCIVQWQKGRPVAVHPESIAVSKGGLAEVLAPRPRRAAEGPDGPASGPASRPTSWR